MTPDTSEQSHRFVRRVARDRPVASPNCLRRHSVLERPVRNHVHGRPQGRDQRGGRSAGNAVHRYLRVPFELYEREVHRHDHSGPPPRNPTVPQPVQFTWDGSSWTQVNDFQWDCMMPDTTIQWNPARAEPATRPNPTGHFPASCTPRS